MNRLVNISVLAVFLLATHSTFGHSGGTNSSGCHTNRKTGDYHCHNKKPRHAQEVTYCHIYDAEARCGYSLGSCKDLREEFGGQCVRD